MWLAPSVVGGRYEPLEQTAAQSIAFPSPLSLQRALDAVVPRLVTPLRA